MEILTQLWTEVRNDSEFILKSLSIMTHTKKRILMAISMLMKIRWWKCISGAKFTWHNGLRRRRVTIGVVREIPREWPLTLARPPDHPDILSSTREVKKQRFTAWDLRWMWCYNYDSTKMVRIWGQFLHTKAVQMECN